MRRADTLAKSYPGKEHHNGFDDYPDHPDAQFIVEARQLVPELIAAIELLAAELGQTWEAAKDGRLVILPAPAKEGDPKPDCFYNDNAGLWCNGMAPTDGDEPTERCKNCWYCEHGYAAEEG